MKTALGVAVIAIVVLGLWLISPNFLPSPTLDQDLEHTDNTILLSGPLQQVDSSHTGSGTVQLAQSDAGNQSIFFIDVSFTDGPDLYVYLSKKSSFSGISDDPGEYVNLGRTLIVTGTFSKAIPDSINGTDYSSVLIYCREYSVLFTYAILE
jgi:hypothetical protein